MPDFDGPYSIVEAGVETWRTLYKVTYKGEIVRGDQAKHLSLAARQAALLNEAYWHGYCDKQEE